MTRVTREGGRRGNRLSSPGRPFAARRRRAIALLDGQPCAEEMLGFYLELLEMQERVYDAAQRADWLARVRSPSEGDYPWLRLERLPVGELIQPLRRFLADVADASNDVLSGAAEAITGAGDAFQERMLQTYVERDSLDSAAEEVGREASHVEFFARALVGPVAELLRWQRGGELAGSGMLACPGCGWPPQVSAIADRPDAKGQRQLVCALCHAWWPYPRSTCAACGEADPDRLAYHTSDSLPHVRIEECASCRTYLKTVDLRIDGAAEPVVDDLASTPLDLWSVERGLTKVQTNLLGL